MRKIVARDGYWLTNDAVYCKVVYLGRDDDGADWREATQDEYEAWVKEQETPPDPPEEPATAEDYENALGVFGV